MFFSPERHGKFTWAIRIFVIFVLTSAFGICRSFAQSQPTESPVASIPIFVSDFELFAVPAAAIPPATPITTPSATPIATPSTAPIATPPATPIASPPAAPIATPPATPIAAPPAIPAAAPSKQKPPSPAVNADTDLPSVQARRLTDFFSATLLQILQRKGYSATRASGQNPSSGVLLRGVFAESDAKNRIRRSLWGGASTNSRFFLYVGIFNLARPDQPLYQLASEQPAGGKFGPVITLNNYIPLAKYELDKNPSEEDVRQICAQIAASLTSVLTANSSAFSE
jgi:hypothetical protein